MDDHIISTILSYVPMGKRSNESLIEYKKRIINDKSLEESLCKKIDKAGLKIEADYLVKKGTHSGDYYIRIKHLTKFLKSLNIEEAAKMTVFFEEKRDGYGDKKLYIEEDSIAGLLEKLRNDYYNNINKFIEDQEHVDFDDIKIVLEDFKKQLDRLKLNVDSLIEGIKYPILDWFDDSGVCQRCETKDACRCKFCGSYWCYDCVQHRTHYFNCNFVELTEESIKQYKTLDDVYIPRFR